MEMEEFVAVSTSKLNQNSCYCCCWWWCCILTSVTLDPLGTSRSSCPITLTPSHPLLKYCGVSIR